MANGLRLSLQGDTRDDPRLRFARVGVWPANDGEPMELVTDAQGRLAYRLSAGDYRLRADDGAEAGFEIRDTGWTRVSLRLP